MIENLPIDGSLLSDLTAWLALSVAAYLLGKSRAGGDSGPAEEQYDRVNAVCDHLEENDATYRELARGIDAVLERLDEMGYEVETEEYVTDEGGDE